jgi:CelD/BcsL family acetyltransferase involved in cellulose biosynthesis
MISASAQGAMRAAPRVAARGPVDVSLIEDAEAFASLKDGWNAVAEASPAASVFLHHDWATAAWAWRRLDCVLSILVASEHGRVIAVLPLVRPHARPRVLELLSVPDTQLADLLVNESEAASAADALAGALAGSDRWDIATFDYLQAGGSLVAHLMPALARHGVKVDLQPRGSNSHIALDGGWSDYFSGRSRRLKKALNLAGNRLRKAGEIRIDRVDSTSGPATLESALAAATTISAASWKSGTGNSLERPGPQAFLRSLAQGVKTCKGLTVWLLHLDGRPLAMELQLVDNGRIHALRSDFLAECETLSPGTHLFRHLLEALFGRGLARYYLGPGDNPYKARWADDAEPVVRLRAYNRTLRGRIAWLRDCVVKPPMRRLRDRWHAARATQRDADAGDG